MRILFVASYNKGRFAPFLLEQAEALRQAGCEVSFFGLQGKGIRGYLSALPELRRKIYEDDIQLVHAHYGLSGLLANLQRKVPVVTTYHGSDINQKRVLPLSQMAIRLSKWNIFVSDALLAIANPKKRYSVIPCGVDLNSMPVITRQRARELLSLNQHKQYILFAGAKDNQVKNYALAAESYSLMKSKNIEMLELKGYSRQEVNVLMQAVDVLLLTSLTEGSPQVIKEAMACGCPIVSVDVGDVRQRTEGVEGCYVADSRDPHEIATLLLRALQFTDRTKGRERIVADQLDNKQIAQRLLEIYNRAV